MEDSVGQDAISPVPPELLKGLNPEQQRAVSILEGPLLIVAGPGSGKTRVLTHRIAALLATGVPARRILAVTFTNKAASEMRDRLGRLVGEQALGSMWVATFHSACARLLRIYHEPAGLPRTFTILDTLDSRRVLADALDTLGLLEGLDAKEVKEYTQDAISRISRAKNNGLSPTTLPTYEGELGKAWQAYAARLEALGAVDFDDILLRTLHLMEKDPALSQEISSRFSHVLVDEYQDTNPVQEKLLNHLAQGGNLCVVGDPDQSIYAFRGATPGVMEQFTETWKAAEVVVLGRNYRSTANILKVASAIIEVNPAKHRAHLETEADPGAPISVYAAGDSDEEAQRVASLIYTRGTPWSEQAVLVRTNALTRPLESAFKRQGIPYQVVGGPRFFDRMEVKDALAWLRLSTNPQDAMAFIRAVSSPKRGIGDVMIAQVMSKALDDGLPVLEAARLRADEGGRGAGALTSFLSDLSEVQAALPYGPSYTLKTIMYSTGMRQQLAANALKESGIDREANLDELITDASKFEKSTTFSDEQGRPVASLSGEDATVVFCQYASLATEGDEDEGPKVSLMTMHAAKGREFDHVYIVGLEENVLPHSRALESGRPEELAEERRLLFVAASRPRKTLDLSWCEERFAYGRSSDQSPSRFLRDLPEESIVKSGGSSSRVVGGLIPSRVRSAPRNPSNWKPGTASRPKPPTTPGPRIDLSKVSVGTEVQHSVFGKGTVLSLKDTVLEVSFISSGVKMLDASRAPLELV